MPRPIQNSFDRLIFLFLFSLRRTDESRILTKLQGFDFEHEGARLLDTNEIIVYKKWTGVKEERDYRKMNMSANIRRIWDEQSSFYIVYSRKHWL